MAENPTTNAQGERSIALGGDVIRSILITGDHNRVFVGDYERLRDAYIEPWSVFERVNLERFTGREWLAAEVDAFLQENDRGYFVLEADAGLGKTTFLAHLVKERGYIHHFVELAPGPNGIAPGLRNLAAQLVRAWELAPYLAEGVLPGSTSRPDFLQNLLCEAARKRDEVRSGEKIVLVVDALDEAGTPYGQNVLGLPEVLPEGVCLIVSHRPVEVALKVEVPRRVFRLRAGDRDNLADMRRHLERAAMWEGVARALAEQGYGREQFVETLLARCRGVWIYLHYVVGEIERGERSPLDLEALPEGVWQYYAEYWARWREKEEWYNTYLPLLSTLAAAQEGLALPLLRTLAGVEAGPGLRRLLDERWRPFLAVEERRDGRRYRLYHASLREFLDGRVDLRQLREAERSLARELAAATREAHGHIADRYLTAWGGLEAGLPGLREPGKQGMDGGYGLRYVAAHLEGTGRADDLHRLLRTEWVDEEAAPYTRRGLRGWLDRLLGRRRTRIRRRYENAWYAAKEAAGDTAGYLADVARAWRLAETLTPPPAADAATPSSLPPGRREEGVGGKGEGLGLQCRYALITASLNSLAKNIPPALLAALVEKGIWTPLQALAYARQVPDSIQRAEALLRLIPYLPSRKKGNISEEIIVAAQEIGEENSRTNILAAIEEVSLYLPANVEIQILHNLWAPKRTHIVPLKSTTGVLGKVVISIGEFEKIVDLMTRLNDISGLHRAFALALATGGCEGAVSMGMIADAWERLGFPQEANTSWRNVWKLLEEIETNRTNKSLLLHLITAEHPTPEEMFAAASKISDPFTRAYILVMLATSLSEPLRRKAIQKALTAAQQMPNGVEVLTGLAPRLAELGHPQEVLAAVREIQQASAWVKALTRLTPYLPRELRKQIVEAREIWNAKHAKALAVLASHLPEPLKGEALREALAAAREIKNEWCRAEALAGLTSHLPEGLLREAMAAAREIKDERYRAEALADLAPHLIGAKRALPLLREALAAAREIKNEWCRAEALADLAPHLPEELLWEALAAARGIKDERYRAEALTGLAPHLPEPLKGEALWEALAVAREIWDAGDRARALASLAPHLSEPLKNEALRDVLAAVREIGWEEYRAQSLAWLAPHLPEGLLREALAAAREIEDTYDRARALAALAPHLPEGLLREALAVARKIKEEYWRDRALASLASRLAELGYPEEALAAAREIESEWARARTLADLAPHLAGWAGRDAPAAYAAWKETLHVLARRTRQDLLSDLRALSPFLAALGGAEAVAGTFRAIQDVGRWWP